MHILVNQFHTSFIILIFKDINQLKQLTMSTINIYILVDTEKIKNEQKPGKIDHSAQYISMYDDQYQGLNKRTDDSELVTSVDPGDLIVWTILPKDKYLKDGDDPQFNSIDDTTSREQNSNEALFTEKKALIFNKNKMACAAVSDAMTGTNSYIISFKIGYDTFWWDPLMEARGGTE